MSAFTSHLTKEGLKIAREAIREAIREAGGEQGPAADESGFTFILAQDLNVIAAAYDAVKNASSVTTMPGKIHKFFALDILVRAYAEKSKQEIGQLDGTVTVKPEELVELRTSLGLPALGDGSVDSIYEIKKAADDLWKNIIADLQSVPAQLTKNPKKTLNKLIE